MKYEEAANDAINQEPLDFLKPFHSEINFGSLSGSKTMLMLIAGIMYLPNKIDSH